MSSTMMTSLEVGNAGAMPLNLQRRDLINYLIFIKDLSFYIQQHQQKMEKCTCPVYVSLFWVAESEILSRAPTAMSLAGWLLLGVALRLNDACRTDEGLGGQPFLLLGRMLTGQIWPMVRSCWGQSTQGRSRHRGWLVPVSQPRM